MELSEQESEVNQPRKTISEITPEEYPKYLSVPGWRVWKTKGMLARMQDIFESEEDDLIEPEPEEKPMTLGVGSSSEHAIFYALVTKYCEVTGTVRARFGGVGTRGGPGLFLEPLDEEELAVARQEVESASSPAKRPVIIKPQELKELLELAQTQNNA